MKYKIQKLILLTLLLVISSSCSKKRETEIQPLGDTYISININSTQLDEQIQNFKSAKLPAVEKSQTGNISSNDGCEIIYELVKVNNNDLGEAFKNQEISISNASRAAIKQSTLSPGSQYRVLVYQDDNSLNFDQTYTYSNLSSFNLNLNAGKEYTFIIYSFNTKNLPINTLINKENLTNARLVNLNQELLFYKEKVKLSYGANSLNAILKYMFTTISTSIIIDRENIFGPMTNLTNAFLKPTRSNATLPLQSGTLLYNDEKTTGEQIVFPTIPPTGVYTITSSEDSKLINPITTNGQLLIGKIIIDGREKNNLVINNIKISPGVKYKLNITFKTCTKTVESNIFDWDYIGIGNGAIRDKYGVIHRRGTILKSEVSAPGSDFGYIMNITKLDNSFNMQINSKKIAPSEIQFETKTDVPQNVRFKDGAKHQGNNAPGLIPTTLPAIYGLSGTNENPVIRVVIDVNRNVRMFAKKRNSDNILYELELFNPSTNQTIPFNKIDWLPSSQINKIIVTQRVDNNTSLIGVGVSKNIVKCSQ